MPEQYEIIAVSGHYEVYIEGKFYCTADTINEAEKELKEVNNGNFA